jgi:Tol biopolymer transport system component
VNRAASTALLMFAMAMLVVGCTGSGSPSAPSRSRSGSIVYLAPAASHQLGIDNLDLVAARRGRAPVDITRSAAAEGSPAWSADGSHVVFERTSSHTTGGGATLTAGIYTMKPGGVAKEILRCAAGCRDGEFAWSPGGGQIAFVREFAAGTSPGSAIEVMNADGSGLHLVCDWRRCGQGLADPQWSPDGTRLLFSNQNVIGFIGLGIPPSGVWVASADGSGLRKLTQSACRPGTSTLRGCYFDSAAAWSPDGRTIAFSRLTERLRRASVTRLELMSPDGRDLRTIAACQGDVCNQEMAPVWSPDGSRIAYARGVERDPVIGVVTPSGLATTIRTCSGRRCVTPQGLVWSPDGRALAFMSAGLPTAVYSIALSGGPMHRIAGGINCCLAWLPRGVTGAVASLPLPPTSSPSGALAFTNDRADPGNDDYRLTLLTVSTGHTGLAPLGPQNLQVDSAAWSPDARKLAVASRGRLSVLDEHGMLIRRLPGEGTQPAWSPDGRTIAFVTDAGLEAIRPDGSGQHMLARGFAEAPAWSPNGRTIAVERGSRIAEIWLLDADGRHARPLIRLPGEEADPAWSPDGRRLAFRWFTAAGSALYVVGADGRGLRRVTSRPIGTGPFAWSPDGRWIAVAQNDGYQHCAIQAVDVRTGGVEPVVAMPGEITDMAWKP